MSYKINLDSKLETYKSKIEDRIKDLFPEDNPLNKAMRYSLLTGGKRVRPLLCLLVYDVIKGSPSSDVYDIALSLELVHTYSLVHDDLPALDNDTTRRGKPTTHVVFGEDIAILVGDGLLTHAFFMISNTNLPDKAKNTVVKTLSAATGPYGMVIGQVYDILVNNDKIALSLELLKEIHLNKTAKFLGAAAKIGAIVAGADTKLIGISHDYGINLGLAFQLIDDIMDVDKDEKVNMAKLLGLNEARKLAEEYTNLAVKAADLLDKQGLLREFALRLLRRKT